MHLTRKKDTRKGWLVGPWNSEVPIPIGYANAGVDEEHYHSQMYEVYLVAQGQSAAVVDGQKIELKAGDILVVEPGEVHTFVNSTEDYLHFVTQMPFVHGDKHMIKDGSMCDVEDGWQAREQAWSRLSPAGAPDRLLYLDALSATEFAQAYKRQSFELLDVQEGDWVLDVGCGTGDDVRMLAQRVGHTGRAVGVDNDAAMVAEAHRRGAGKTLPVAFHLCDVHHLAFREDVFDCCRADRVFQHLEDPRRALAEIVRVARPGARIVVIEPDWETLVVDVADRVTTRKIANFICDRMVRHGWIGRQLPNLFRACGLAEIGVAAGAVPLTNFTLADRLWGLRRNAQRAQNAGVVSTSEAAAWIESLEQASQSNRFFGAVTGFAVCGRKPEK